MPDEFQSEQPKKRRAWRKVKNAGLVKTRVKEQRARRRAKLHAEAKIAETVAEIKASRHGGARDGAGRPKNHLKNLNTGPLTATAILQLCDEAKLWNELLHSPHESTRLEVLIYLKDRQLGKPVQPGIFAQFSGQQGQYSDMSPEELQDNTQGGYQRKVLKETIGVLLHQAETDGILEDIGYTKSSESAPKPAPVPALPPALPSAPDYNDPPRFKPAAYEPPTIMPPEPAEKEYFCPKRGHGKYFKPKDQQSTMCPLCIADGLRDRDYLGSLMPA